MCGSPEINTSYSNPSSQSLPALHTPSLPNNRDGESLSFLSSFPFICPNVPLTFRAIFSSTQSPLLPLTHPLSSPLIFPSPLQADGVPNPSAPLHAFTHSRISSPQSHVDYLNVSTFHLLSLALSVSFSSPDPWQSYFCPLHCLSPLGRHKSVWRLSLSGASSSLSWAPEQPGGRSQERADSGWWPGESN